MPTSAASLAFWAPLENLVNADPLTGSYVIVPPIDPLVLHTSGSFPKAEATASCSWEEIENTDRISLQKITLTYKTRGWNPGSVLSEK